MISKKELKRRKNYFVTYASHINKRIETIACTQSYVTNVLKQYAVKTIQLVSKRNVLNARPNLQLKYAAVVGLLIKVVLIVW